MTLPIDRVDLESLDIADLQQQKLKELFPEVFTEGGKIDFDKLKLTLGQAIDAGKERFGMNWAGKADCYKTIQQPSVATLVPARDESIDFDTTENLFIEGDNLEALKLLQKSYLGKVKMIYIDPPYNTGNDFVYPDNYAENLDTYLEYTGQIDGEGRKFSTNVDTDGRFHSKWMNMMYPRLFLAKNLLREDGVIFISIDDNEVKNLRAICDEIFGEENSVAQIANINNPKGRSDDKFIATAHEYLLIYSKNKQEMQFFGFAPDEVITKRYKKIDDFGGIYREIDLRKTGDNDRKEDRPNLFYNFYFNEKTSEFYPSYDEDTPTDFIKIFPTREDRSLGNWRWSIETVRNNIDLLFPKYMAVRKKWGVFEKDYLKNKTLVKATSAWTFKDVNSERGSEFLIDLDFTKELFPKPKPLGLIKRTLMLAANKNDIILDFFAGSATTAHAVMELNKEDEGNRKFICVQLPEPCDEKSEAYKAGYKTIAEISKERIRRASVKVREDIEQSIATNKRTIAIYQDELNEIYDDLLYKLNRVQEEQDVLEKIRTQEKLIEEQQILLEEIDLGFRVFKLQKSNFKVWDASTPKDAEAIQQALELHVDHIDPQAEQEAILFELLLKSGLGLTTPIENLTLAGKTVFSVAEGALLICLDKALTSEVIKAMAELNPSRVICLDEGFQDNDQLKTNAVLIMKSQRVNEFRTV